MKPRTGGYFEGILQIREGNEELMKWVYETVRKDARSTIAKEKKVTNGIDLYFTDQHYLQNLGRRMKEKFIGILKTSRRLHTVDKMTSKLLYRVNVLFKVLPFKRGDIITLHGEKVEILNIGTKAHIKDVKSGAKRYVSLEILKHHNPH